MGLITNCKSIVRPITKININWRCPEWKLLSDRKLLHTCFTPGSGVMGNHEKRTTLLSSGSVPLYSSNQKRKFVTFSGFLFKQTLKSVHILSGVNQNKPYQQYRGNNNKPHMDERSTQESGEVKEYSEESIKRLSMSELEQLYKDATFDPIFQFPLIRVAMVISRLKIFQTAMTVAILPLVTYGYVMGTTPFDLIYMSYSLAGFAGIILYGLSFYFRRLIGVISMSEDEKIIRVGKLTFWGNRKNLFYYVDDVVQFSDSAENLKDVLIKFQAYSDPNAIYMSLTHGKIVNVEKFRKVFGSCFSQQTE